MKEYKIQKRKQIKKISVLFLLALCVSVCFAGCGKKKKKPKDSLEESVEYDLYDQGLELIDRMQVLKSDRGYVINIGLPSKIQDEYERLMQCPYETMTDVYRVSHLEDATDTFIKIASEKMQDVSTSYFKERLAEEMANMVISYTAGADELAIAGLLAQESCFVNSELTTSEVYIYCYADSYPIMVSFIPGNGGAVRIKATYLLSDRLLNVGPEALADAVRGYFNATSLECITR